MSEINKNARLYGAYGSNLNLEQMKFRCPTARVIGTSLIKDYKLLFRGWKNTAVATIEPEKGKSVPILIWEIEPSDEQSLDRYEGLPRFYCKKDFTVEFNGKPTKIMVYVMNEGYPIGQPSCDYFSIVRHGYASAGFDIKILNDALKVREQKQKDQKNIKQERY
ncbi:MAG: gamma-glutamylcyclotransferase [Oscillospiraceae bacterium]|jgi:hypothetical protein|nr:gamma-glutamylcyclotransferase [Oscillospiraceae bacterium]